MKAIEGFTLQPSKSVGLPPGIIDISAPGYNARANLGAQGAKICRALQFTNQANFDKRFGTNVLETFKIHISIRINILSNFVSVVLEQGERLGGLAGWGVEPFYGAAGTIFNTGTLPPRKAAPPATCMGGN